MNKTLKIVLGAAMLSSLVMSAAFAGENAGGSCKLGWLAANGTMKPAINETACVPKMGVTAKGLTRLRGIDVQLYINGAGGVLPPSWQWWVDNVAMTNGCAAGSESPVLGFKTSGAQAAIDSIYNAFSQAPILVASTAQNGNQYYNVNSCLTPHGVGMIWFAAAGTSSVTRAASKTYGLCSLAVDQNSGCAGDCSDPQPVCINLQFRQPCGDPGNPRGAVVGVTDTNGAYDFLAATPGSSFLTWMGGNATCPGVTAIKTGTWGQLKRAYR